MIDRISSRNNLIIQTIRERTSTRSFKNVQIKEDELDAIIECGIASPSSRNAQPWYFIVVKNKALLSRINSDIHSAVMAYGDDQAKAVSTRENFDYFYGAPTVVFVAGETQSWWSSNDCGIASYSIMLAAHSLGIGSCVIGLARRLFDCEIGEKYQKELGVPEGFKLLFGISLGYVEKRTPLSKRRQDVVKVIL